ncbi:phosphoserine transaminase [Hyphococcus sp.]|uniref:phosphoserine transaminase n=1 Tax=Hyphococcus sp. TaxID=2038636 RepID=UPI0020845EE4|nr:MAG: phosphoserine aminotransferase [Marinicaulis sp.]
MIQTTPAVRPVRPHFSSGPCAKRPGWSPENFNTDTLGRSHRSKLGKARLAEAIDRTRALLGVPDDFRIGIVPASDTGAVEMAMWSMLGPRPVDMLAWESFGEGWITDVVKQLKLDARILKAGYGEIADLAAVDPAHDVVFTWNGTTSGVRVPNADWISAEREGVVMCDATSAIFAQELDWAKLDVVTYSWQKVLGGEGAHGVLILSPRAVERLESYTPSWPMPKLFRMVKGGKLNEDIFTGATINTPSMLCVEDYIDALRWAEDIGGIEALHRRADANAASLGDWVESRDWIDFLCADPSLRSNTSVCLKIVDSQIANLDDGAQRAFVKAIEKALEKEQAAYDIGGYRDAPPGLRIWCGATVETADIKALGPWLDWAFSQAKSAL